MGQLSTLGERGGDYSDEGYTGQVSTSSLSLDYWREKAREFQTILNSLDSAYLASLDMLTLPITDESREVIQGGVWDYENRRTGLKVVAEGVNAAAAAINAVGGRMPSLSIPQTLGMPAVILTPAILAGFAAMMGAIVWGREWIVGQNQRIQTAQLLESISPEERSAAASAALQVQTAASGSTESTFSAVAGYVKWGAIAVAAWLAYKALKDSKILDRWSGAGNE